MTNRAIAFTFIGIAAAGLIAFLIYNNNKKPATLAGSTGSGNSLNLNLGGLGAISNPGGYGTTPDGTKTVNGLTANEYLANGFTQDEVNQMFA